jgi:hypothetical protein
MLSTFRRGGLGAAATVLFGLAIAPSAGAQCAGNLCDDITYSTSGTGGSSVTCFECEEDEMTGDVHIVIVAESMGVFTIDIQCFDGVRIASCNVKNTGEEETRLVINFENGDFDGLAQVVDFRKSTAMDSTGEVWIETMNPSGNIGPTELHTTNVIRADRIQTLQTGSTACLTAEVIAHGSAITGQNVAIDTIQVGDIFHDITAESDSIGTITVSGNIGDPDFENDEWVVIMGKRDVTSITASAIYADITTV